MAGKKVKKDKHTMRREYIKVDEPQRLAYRVRTFCAAVGIGRTKFYELMQAGQIRTITIGGRRLVPADEVQRIARDGCA
jgi:excisionase family DNA binding protein